MAIFTTLTKPGASVAAGKAARDAVTAYRDAGNGSNRTEWERMTLLLAAVIDVAYGAGVPIDVSALFPADGSSGYHKAHRALKPAIFAEHWHRVQVVALRNAKWEGRTVSGETDTVRGTTILICPVA